MRWLTYCLHMFRVHVALWLHRDFLKIMGSSKYDFKNNSGGRTSGSGITILPVWFLRNEQRNVSPCPIQRTKIFNLLIKSSRLCATRNWGNAGFLWDKVNVGGKIASSCLLYFTNLTLHGDHKTESSSYGLTMSTWCHKCTFLHKCWSREDGETVSWCEIALLINCSHWKMILHHFE